VRRLAWSLACLALGCPSPAPKHVALYPMTAAPPARTLEVLNKSERHSVTVSSGVAFGVTTSDSCENTPEPPTLEIADESVLKHRPLARGTSKREWVLLAVRPGKTTLTVRAQCATQSYEVTVVAP